MATNLAIDPDLLDRAVEGSGERTKKATITKALREFIARRQQRRLLELMGKLEPSAPGPCGAHLCSSPASSGMIWCFLSTDNDFALAAKHCALRLWQPQAFIFSLLTGDVALQA